MSLLRELYKTREQESQGKFILLAFGILIVVGLMVPNWQPQESEKQMYSLSGLATKYNDRGEISQFIGSIKKNNGYLVLGTSETTSLTGGNYYDFLNSDPDLSYTGFSVLAGAGRTCGNIIPILLDQKNDLKGLQLIYFVNPVYWRKDLCEVNLDYGQRYMNYFMTTRPNLTLEEKEKYYSPIAEFQTALNITNKATASLDYIFRSLFRNYSYDLKNTLFGEYSEEKKTFVEERRGIKFSRTNYKNRLVSIDTLYNIEKSFSHKNWFKPINEKVDFRTEELKAFINVCKDLEINATFILGPTNERFIQAYSASSLNGYQDVSEQLKTLFEEQSVPHIDARHINNELGAFSDHQHHSSYGAFLIYEQIKMTMYEETK